MRKPYHAQRAAVVSRHRCLQRMLAMVFTRLNDTQCARAAQSLLRFAALAAASIGVCGAAAPPASPASSDATQDQIRVLYARTTPVPWQAEPSTSCTYDERRCARHFGPQGRFALAPGGRQWRDRQRALPVQLYQFAPSRTAPALDAHMHGDVQSATLPASGLRVYCASFPYDGGLNSGSFQYWNPALLIISTPQRAVLYRFDGYDANHCGTWRSDGDRTLVLPLLQPVYTRKTDEEWAKTTPLERGFPNSHYQFQLALLWWTCTLDGCSARRDQRAVVSSPDGRLWQTQPIEPPFARDLAPGEVPWAPDAP